ncbi:hypothetical protein XPN_0490, partial [Xanthomonas arboricola pv. pruni MAFF 301427]
RSLVPSHLRSGSAPYPHPAPSSCDSRFPIPESAL